MNQDKSSKLSRRVVFYIPKHEQNFIKFVHKFIEKKFENRISISRFYITAVKEYINNLPKEDQKLFEEAANEVVKENTPSTKQFVEKFIDDIT